MEHKLYRILEQGEIVEGGDMVFWHPTRKWRPVKECFVNKPSDDSPLLRPVSSNQPTATESPELDEQERHTEFVYGLASVHHEIREDQRMKRLREQYAGLAMQGFIHNPDWSIDGIAGSIMTWDDLGEASVKAADSLIAALNKKEETV